MQCDVKLDDVKLNKASRVLRSGFCCGVVMGMAALAGCNGRGAQDGMVGQRAEAPQVSPTVIAASASVGQRISKALSKEPKLRGAYITVGVSNLDRKIYLSGSVTQAAQEKLALKVAQALASDAKVVSQLTVATPRLKKQPAKSGAAKNLKVEKPVTR